MQFYENFINMCNAINKSPSSVAQALGISKSNVTAWKKGSTPKSEVLSIIAEYFAVSADYLLGLSDIKKAAVPEDDGLSELDCAIVEAFRKLPEDEQKRALAYLDFLKQQQ